MSNHSKIHFNELGRPRAVPFLAPRRREVCLFDVDGILYDSLPYYVRAWRAALKAKGVHVDPVEIFMREGTPAHEIAADLLLRRGVAADCADEVALQVARLVADMGKPPVQYGIKRLIRTIRRDKYSLGVVTASADRTVRQRLSCDFDPSLFSALFIHAPKASHGEARREPYLDAARTAGVAPRRVIVFENSPLGVRAAKMAGMFCVGLNTDPLDPAILRAAGADMVFSDCRAAARSWLRIRHEFEQCL